MARQGTSQGGGSKGKLTPMMAQYQRLKQTLPDDVILFFRLGDFYEMFFEDAKEAAGILNVALTKRNGVPMCGVPHHSAQGYMAKLIQAGKRVAIGEQTSAPQQGKIVEREVTQILTAGTIDDVTLLDDKKPNYLAAAYRQPGRHGCYALACADHSTGEFRLAEYSSLQALQDELARLNPRELLIPDDQVEALPLPNAQEYDGYTFLHESAELLLREHFRVASLHGFGCAELMAAVSAAGALLHYLTYQLRRDVHHLRSLHVLEDQNHLLIDAASQRNLDLVDNRQNPAHTLLHVLDHTTTPMGSRLLRHWILHPLRDQATIESRQEMVASLLAEPYLLDRLREHLRQIRDIERSSSRLSQQSGNPRDLKSLEVSLAHLPELKADLTALIEQHAPSQAGAEVHLAGELLRELGDFSALVAHLEQALVDDPPASPREGGLIREGHLPMLDELHQASREGKDWIANLQKSERERTGIDSLKIKFNNVFGYYIEVTKANLSRVPEDYQRKQTMANAERFITPELKEMEGKILGSEERSKQLEYEEFQKLRDLIAEHLAQLQQTARALATLDILLSFAETAQRYRHCRPELTRGGSLQIVNGRHPVLEQTLVAEPFVPNDTTLHQEDERLHLLTGPNMAGKSTYIRQVALITLMAHLGAYVPAEQATIRLIDRIFCRVGASDNLAQGQSTFMVEMSETALIINNATADSLVILDEVGRGTATFDGLSIAWAVAEHLHDVTGCLTLFATHYHELCDLAHHKPAAANYNVAVREWNDEIIFLHKILPGPADKSYGIQVARLAGLPESIIARAKSLLGHLEQNATRPPTGPKARATRKPAANQAPGPPESQMNESSPEETPQLRLF